MLVTGEKNNVKIQWHKQGRTQGGAEGGLAHPPPLHPNLHRQA